MKSSMIAKFKNGEFQNAKNYSGDKELVNRWQVIGLKNGEQKAIIDCRCWMGRGRNSSMVYASVWINDNGIHRSGNGSAGGYGYHKASAAIDGAIQSAGVELYGTPCSYSDEPVDYKKRAYINGVGEQGIELALGAIARKMGYRKFIIV